MVTESVFIILTQWSQFLYVIYLTNRFHVAVRLFSNRSQMTSKCRKNKEVAHEPQASVSLLFLPHFDVLCDLLLNRPTETWNLLVLYNDQKRKRTGSNVLFSFHTRVVDWMHKWRVCGDWKCILYFDTMVTIKIIAVCDL